jgi:hypothetical protein
MNEVVVTAKKPLIEVKPDKLVFNVESSINATATHWNYYRNHCVIVDRMKNIQLSGKNGVQISLTANPSTGRNRSCRLFTRTKQQRY